MFIGILYNSRQRKKYDEWKEKENQAIYDLGQILVCDRAQAKFVIDQLGRHAVPIDVVVEPMSVVSIHGESSFVKGARLRLKESDRLVAVANLVRDLGGTVREDGDDLYIIGSGILKGGQGDCVNDHRLVMAGTLMALISETPVILQDSEAITKSYPDFFEDWNMLGGNAQQV